MHAGNLLNLLSLSCMQRLRKFHVEKAINNTKTYPKRLKIDEIAKRIRKLPQLVNAELRAAENLKFGNVREKCSFGIHPLFSFFVDSTYIQNCQLGELDQWLRELFEFIEIELQTCIYSLIMR